MKKFLLGILAFCLTTAWAAAEEPELKDDYPATYTVKEGDTLWDISGVFLRNPWMWPEIWQVNPQIKNPHLIYPGDRLRMIYIDGRPVLTLQPSGEVRLSPSIISEPMGNAIPAIPLDAIAQFLTGSRVLQQGLLENSPYVVSGAGGRIITAPGDDIYVRGEVDESVKIFGIYRMGKIYRDPVTEEILGRQAKEIGTARLDDVEGDIHTMNLIRTNSEVRIGDHVLPSSEFRIQSVFHPSAPEDDVEGVIMAVEGGVSQVGNLSVVALNLGARDNLQDGTVLAIFKKGETIRDRVTNETITLPAERSGLLMIFRTFDKMSYAIILRASRPPGPHRPGGRRRDRRGRRARGCS